MDAPNVKPCGSWYEFSKAAHHLEITEKQLKQRIRSGDPRLKKDRNTKQDSPFGEATYVYVAPVDKNAESEAILLTEWLSLCKLLRDDGEVNFSEAEEAAYQQYTGENGINLEAMRSSDRFISASELKAMLKAKAEEKKSKNKDEASGEKQGTDTDTQAREDPSSTGGTAHSENSGTRQKSGGDEHVNYVRECTLCLNSKLVADHPDKTYCLSKWDYSKGAWRSRQCRMNTTSEEEANNKKLWNQSNECQCMKCFNAKNSITRTNNSELFEGAARSNTSGADREEIAGIVSDEDLRTAVVKSYHQLRDKGEEAEVAKAIADDQAICEHMLVLQYRGISSVECGDGKKILICSGVDDTSGRCGAVSIVRVQANNADVCETCRKRKNHVVRRDRERKENWARRVDPMSKVNTTKLTPDELMERTRRANQQRKKAVRKAKVNLAKALAVEVAPINTAGAKVDEDDAFQKRHSDFMDCIKKSLEHASAGARREEFKATIESTLIEVMREGVMSERKDDSIDFDKKDVAQLVQLVVENIDNAVQKLSGKPGQIRHSTTAYQIAWSQYKRSKAGYRATSQLTPFAAPHMRELSRLKSVSKVEDGQDAKLYEARLRLKKQKAAAAKASTAATTTVGAASVTAAASATAASTSTIAANAPLAERSPASQDDDRLSEHGVLMVDEIKVKHNMIFNSQTLEPLGMANDDLDLKTMMRSLLTNSDDLAKPAVYVSQWRYKDFVTNEAWNCSYFLNDGSLTGETLLRQMQYVVMSCESIGSRVYGICFDAGGNNARLMKITRGGKSLTDSKVAWIDDDICYMANEYDPDRRVYLYFCLTHQLKAMRNQFLASLLDGAKSFKDENGISFGWALIQKLRALIEHLDPNVDYVPRITDAVAYPTKYSKMSVSDAKKVFEVRTLAYLENYFCDALGIKKSDLDVSQSDLVSKYIEEDGQHSPSLKLGNMFYRSKKLMDIALSRRRDFDSPSLSPTDREASAPEASKHDEPNYVSEDLLSEIAGYRYLTAVGAIFNDLLSDTKERFNKKNIGAYTGHLKNVMTTYFETWKEAQLNRKAAKDSGWKESFLDDITFSNLRSSVCSFTHFCTYVLETVTTFRGDKFYVPVMIGNQTSLEGFFSVTRGGDFDFADRYGSNISNETTDTCFAAMKKSSYDASDIGVEKGGGVTSGMTAQKSYFERRAKAVESWKTAWADRLKTGASCDRFPSQSNPILKSHHSKRILSKMKEVPVPRGHDVVLFARKSFQDWRRLSIGTTFEPFFVKIIAVPVQEINSLFQNIHSKLFGFIDAFISNSTCANASFEYQLHKYLVSNSFKDFYTKEFPVQIRGNCFGALVVVRCLAEIHEEWFFESLRQLHPRPPSDDGGLAALSSEQVDQLIHRFVGAAVRQCLVKFRKCGASKKYGKVAAAHAKPLLHSMRLSSLQDALSDDDYMENYYPPCIQHFNQGGLSLLKKELFPWARSLVKLVWSSLPDSVISTYRKDSIKKAAEGVYNDEAIPLKFITSIRSGLGDSTTPVEALKKVHKAIVTFVFLAYSGMRWDNKFGDKKKKRGSNENVSFRTVVQLNGGKTSSDRSSGRGKKRKRSPNANALQKLAENFREAERKIRAANNVVVKEGSEKLTKPQLTALLWFCYGEYESFNTKDLTYLQDELGREISRDVSKIQNADAITIPDSIGVNASKAQKLDRWNANKSLDQLTKTAAKAGDDIGDSANSSSVSNDDIVVEEMESDVDAEDEGEQYEYYSDEDEEEDEYQDNEITFDEALARMPLP